jgi:hypothetical protein
LKYCLFKIRGLKRFAVTLTAVHATAAQNVGGILASDQNNQYLRAHERKYALSSVTGHNLRKSFQKNAKQNIALKQNCIQEARRDA